jgi:hypothetical protein
MLLSYMKQARILAHCCSHISRGALLQHARPQLPMVQHQMEM